MKLAYTMMVLLAFNMLTVGTSSPNTLESNLDKNGTTGRQNESRDSQPLVLQVVANRGSLNTERAGFEPAVGCDPYNGLASRRDRPLCHLSGAWTVPPTLSPNYSMPHFLQAQASALRTGDGVSSADC